ncbi:MAG TPA: hypothetical protein VMU05_18005 [Dongiaceae bacterium]|nr:hypothetical protein [Dongiaceae bacterium]
MIPYQKFTQCTDINGYVPNHAGFYISVGVLAVMVGAALATLVSFALIPTIISGLIALVLGVIAFCTWYLYHRLICLNPTEVCAIGVVTGVLHPTPQTIAGKAGDNDATLNILLAPGPLNYGQDISEYTSHVQGNLIAAQVQLTNAGLPYVTSSASTDDFNHRKGLHCEFEGDGIAILLAFAEAILVLLIAILALTVLAGPWAAPLIWLLAIIAAMLGASGLFNDLANPPVAQGTDLQGNPGNVAKGQIVLVSGDWIYDGGHDGWNEIHAVHNCQIISDQVLDLSDSNVAWPSEISGMPFVTDADVSAVVNFWCGMLSQAGGAVKGGTMTNPANNWVVHPLVDGCNQSPVIV